MARPRTSEDDELDGADSQPLERITHAQAGALLGTHTSTVAKLVTKGVLTSTGVLGPSGGTLDLNQVLALREQRLHAEAERRLRYDRVDPPRHGPPPDLGDADWLSVAQVARRLGVTEQAVRARAQRGTIPHTRHGKRIWVRSDLLDVWVAARTTAGPDDVPAPTAAAAHAGAAASGSGKGSYTTPATRWPRPSPTAPGS